MWGMMNGRKARPAELEFCLFKAAACLAALLGGERAVCALIHIKDAHSPGLLAFLIKPCLERYLWGGNFGLKLEESKSETELGNKR